MVNAEETRKTKKVRRRGLYMLAMNTPRPWLTRMRHYKILEEDLGRNDRAGKSALLNIWNSNIVVSHLRSRSRSNIVPGREERTRSNELAKTIRSRSRQAGTHDLGNVSDVGWCKRNPNTAAPTLRGSRPSTISMSQFQRSPLIYGVLRFQ